MHVFSITSFLLVIPLSAIVSRLHSTVCLIQWNVKRFDSRMECFSLLIAVPFSSFHFTVLEERNCSDPGGPVNGYKEITGGPGLINGRYAKIGTVMSFFCNNSYVLSGNEMRTCQQNGEWSGKQPICIKGNLQICLKSVEIDGVAGHFGSSRRCFWAPGKMHFSLKFSLEPYVTLKLETIHKNICFFGGLPQDLLLLITTSWCAQGEWCS